MKLSEKIFTCRKKAGLSQEALAERLGVSRQAVSKWETGESEPEIGKLKLMAETFSVSVDWLLSEEETIPEKPGEKNRSWTEEIPGVLGKVVRAYGWFSGIAMAVAGVLFTAMSLLLEKMSKTIGGGLLQPADNPMSFMWGFMRGLGVVLLLAGITLAVIIKRRSRK